jgi:multidrug efflux system outer membrane protein
MSPIKQFHSSRMTRRAVLGLLGCQMLVSCTFIPKLNLPDAPVSSRYPRGGKTSTASSEIAWRQVFNDARLVRLIDIALANNRDLRVAMLRVEEARAQYRIERSALLPNVSQGSDFSRSHQSGTTSNQWQLNLGSTSYELDLFGRIRSLSAKALEQYLGKTEAQRAAQVTLVAELATQYYTVRQFDELIANTKLTLAAVEESYRLNNSIFKAGGLLELDLRSSEAQVLTAKANLIAYQRQRDQAENGLVLMLGQPTADQLGCWQIAGRCAREGCFRRRAFRVASGPPRHPGSRAHTCVPANADIGAARAAFFPSIKLTAMEGTASADLTSLFSKGTAAWSFAPQITLPIFTGGRNRANLDAAKSSPASKSRATRKPSRAPSVK